MFFETFYKILGLHLIIGLVLLWIDHKHPTLELENIAIVFLFLGIVGSGSAAFGAIVDTIDFFYKLLVK